MWVNCTKLVQILQILDTQRHNQVITKLLIHVLHQYSLLFVFGSLSEREIKIF
jgi:hypothetical protein